MCFLLTIFLTDSYVSSIDLVSVNIFGESIMKNYLFLIALGLLAVDPALAYIDPGSGSTIMSVIIGLIMAIGLVIKTYWYKLISLFSGKNSSNKTDSQ